MFKFDNTHIFTGYLKQLLSSFNLPTCRVYTSEFARYRQTHNKEDPRVLESFDTILYNDGTQIRTHMPVRINYLKDDTLYNYFWDYSQEDTANQRAFWTNKSTIFYNGDTPIPGLTRSLVSHGSVYDAKTHEYLGDYLRFLRDYYDVNLMSMYNCFNNKIYNNVYFSNNECMFDSQDPNYRIYAFPVKLFANYTIALDCDSGIELFCGLYNTSLDTSTRGIDLISRTYQKVNRTFFNQPFLYKKLSVDNWGRDNELKEINGNVSGQKYIRLVDDKTMSRFDLANREQDLKLFIKIPATTVSTITVLEGDFVGFNDFSYSPVCYDSADNVIAEGDDTTPVFKSIWEYRQNHTVINFGDNIDQNELAFTPITKLQLLAYNTGESYPFADRLVEYLSGSAITPLDEVPDNIKRAQKVMEQNRHYFKINGVWEPKMQKIIYDYITNSGPIEVDKAGKKLVDKHSGHNPRHHGYHRTIGHKSKSLLYDVLGYIDKDAEKWYASWKINDNNKAAVKETIQNVDIYNGLYDI